jgi:hypothetical protein
VVGVGEDDGEVVGVVAFTSTMVGVCEAVLWPGVDEELEGTGVVAGLSTKMSFWAPWTKLYRSR